MDGGEVHPAEFITVKVYAPDSRPVIVVLAVFPVMAPGFIVQLPAGKLLNSKLPVDTAQVGCVTNVTVGAVGVAG